MANSSNFGTAGNGRTDNSDLDAARAQAEADVSDARNTFEKDVDDVTRAAREDFRDATDAARHYADEQKSHAADQLDGIAGAMGRMAEDLGRDGQPLAGKYARDLSEGLGRFSESARSRSFEQLAGDIAHFGREHPAAFLSLAALGGFAASRFAAASANRRGNHDIAPYETPTVPAQPATRDPETERQ